MHRMSENADTVSIEVCHPDETGKFTDATYRSLVQLTAWLCVKFDLKEDQIIRHYDVTGKNCPKYFVENEDAWEMFKDNVWDAVQKEIDDPLVWKIILRTVSLIFGKFAQTVFVKSLVMFLWN